VLVPKPESASDGAAAQVVSHPGAFKDGCKITMFMNILFGGVP